ncbi:MAG: metallophosphoesterase, partial [Verrucomicrobiota bacterium]
MSSQTRRSAPRMSRRAFLRLCAGGTALGAGGLGYGFLVEPNQLAITTRDIHLNLLPPELDGLRVGVIGDLHFRPGHDDRLLKRLVAEVKSRELDLLLVVGDYVEGHDPTVLDPMMTILKDVQAKHGFYAVMGNHDGWAASVADVRHKFEENGLGFLVNQNTQIEINGVKLAIAGTDRVWGGQPDLARTFRGLRNDIPVLALVHEPDFFDQVIRERTGILQVSGHTHGGQCRVPFAGYAPAKVRYGKKYIYGTFEKE